MAFELSNVEENKQFIDCAKLPLTILAFTHRYEVLASGGVQIVHAVEMRGLHAPLFGRMIRSKIRAHLRDAMLTLSDLAAALDEHDGGESAKLTQGH